MTEVRIRNVDPWIVEVIRDIAKKQGRTLEAELKDVLGKHAVKEKNEFLDKLNRGREEQKAKYGVLPDSTPGIRDERDARW